MAKTLEMVFQNKAGKNVTMNITAVKDGVTADEVKTLMQLIITKNIFTSSGGDLTAVASASLVSRDVSAFNVK